MTRTVHAPMSPFPSRGFTLIELLVVVAILSAAAMLALGSVDTDRAQQRYDETRNRLALLERAVLGRLGPPDAALLGGFVADNGVLPTDVATLLDAGTFAARTALSPVFDPQPDTATCANNGGGETTLSDASAALVKGHRGSYLGGAAANGVFRDGWGNENPDAGADALNFGWAVAYNDSQESLTLASLGADNQAGGDDYAADQASTLRAADWLLPIAGWTVRVVNYTGADIAARKMHASLLIYANDAGGGRWRRYSTAAATLCLDGTGDGLVDGAPCAQSATLSFGAGCHPGDPHAGHQRIPQGRHLLVLVNDADATPWTADDAVVFASSPATRPIAAQVNAVAGFALPETRLELR
ncbi:MAG: prepilin-type N-terminal cleavage/methylation domain-containing protein [Propionivibrio sp.]